MYTIKEVAKRIGASRSHVKKLIAKGILKATDIRGEGKYCSWRVSEQDLSEFLESRASSGRK